MLGFVTVRPGKTSALPRMNERFESPSPTLPELAFRTMLTALRAPSPRPAYRLVATPRGGGLVMAIRAFALRLTQQLLAKSNRLRRNLDQFIGLDIFKRSFQ